MSPSRSAGSWQREAPLCPTTKCDTSKHYRLLGQVKSSDAGKIGRTTAELADEEKRSRKHGDSEIDEGLEFQGRGNGCS